MVWFVAARGHLFVTTVTEPARYASASRTRLTTPPPGPSRRAATREQHSRCARPKVNHGLRVNDLRHSPVSFAVAHGANVYAVQRMVGHSKPSITLDVYGELWDDSQEQLATKLDGAIRAEMVAGSRGLAPRA